MEDFLEFLPSIEAAFPQSIFGIEPITNDFMALLIWFDRAVHDLPSKSYYAFNKYGPFDADIAGFIREFREGRHDMTWVINKRHFRTKGDRIMEQTWNGTVTSCVKCGKFMYVGKVGWMGFCISCLINAHDLNWLSECPNCPSNQAARRILPCGHVRCDACENQGHHPDECFFCSTQTIEHKLWKLEELKIDLLSK